MSGNKNTEYSFFYVDLVLSKDCFIPFCYTMQNCFASAGLVGIPLIYYE